MRISAQPLNPTFVEVYGCGNIAYAANHVLRNLNVEGLDALDSGRPTMLLAASRPSNGPPIHKGQEADLDYLEPALYGL